MKKIIALCLLASSVCFANVISYDSTTGTYKLDQYGAPMDSVKSDSGFSKNLSGSIQKQNNDFGKRGSLRYRKAKSGIGSF